jgi:nucleoside-diphosphate-sugar epimerase
LKVLVTGASGFLGSYIVDQCLTEGNTVRVLVRRNSDLSYLKTLKDIEIVFGDMSEKHSLPRALEGVEVIHHSAARVFDFGSRKQFYDTNVLGTLNLLNAARMQGTKRMIYISSPSVLMDMNDQVNLDESFPYPKKFINLYSETKAEAEQLVLEANTPNFVTCSLRPRAIWGPRDRTGFLPKIIAKIASGKLRDISGGKKILASLCYCENAALASVLAAKSNSVGGKAYFITDQENVDVWEFASVIAQTFNLPAITKTVHPAVAKALAGMIDSIWKLPALSHHYSPPISRYSVGLLTLSGTFSSSAATRDFNYVPKVNQLAGLSLLKKWVDEIGGVSEFIRQVK